MSRAGILALGILLTVLGAVAHGATGGLGLFQEMELEKDPRCSSCNFPCPEGTVNCWACGAHVPDAKTSDELGSVKLMPTTYRRPKEASAAGIGASPILQYQEIEEWIDRNPDKFDEAISRLSDMLAAVRGTGLEATVATRMEEVRKAKAEATRPRTPEEREKEAADAYLQVMRQVRRSRNPEDKVDKLRKLLRIARGTSYEQPVARELRRVEALLP